MIVDDSAIIRRKIERCNDADEFKVIAVATNGREALDLFKLTRPEVVTMDLTMPEMDGIQCIPICRISTSLFTEYLHPHYVTYTT